jgi:phage terminase large subunit GpA-like protein
MEAYQRAWRDEGVTDPVAALWDWGQSPRWAVYRVKCPDCGQWAVSNEHAGFQGSKLYSPWPKDQPRNIARKWLAAQNSEDLKQVFYNTQLGLPYRPHVGKDLKIEALAARAEVWAAEIPDNVGAITAGVDVQDYRIEIEIVAWGRNEENWSVAYHVIDGEFSDPGTRDKLDAYLKRIWRRADGRGMEVMATCIDSGGHHTQAVYDFAKARLGRHIWAIKGESARNGQRNPVWPAKRPTSKTKKSFRPIIIGVNAAKDRIRQMLGIEAPGPGYMHYSADRDLNYYAQLTAERSVLKEVGGKRFRVWELPSGKANEALDCRVYAYAALCGLIHFGLKLNARVEAIVKSAEMLLPPAPPPGAAPEAAKEKKSLVHRLA